jgi:hypothetical protein
VIGAEDVRAVVVLAVAALRDAAGRDWSVPAGSLSWSCQETVEHMADDLFAYAGQLGPDDPRQDTHVPFGYRQMRDGGPLLTIYADPTATTYGLIQVLEACGTMLAAVVQTAPPAKRSFHPYGVSDPEGFAAMGVVEILVHMHDVSDALGVDWAPPEDLCARALARLFPSVQEKGLAWPTLLWATGRGDLPGRPRVTDWQWDGTVH